MVRLYNITKKKEDMNLHEGSELGNVAADFDERLQKKPITKIFEHQGVE